MCMQVNAKGGRFKISRDMAGIVNPLHAVVAPPPPLQMPSNHALARADLPCAMNQDFTTRSVLLSKFLPRRVQRAW